jgi:uncharacterized Zn-binding protein involved in type VI secretion
MGIGICRIGDTGEGTCTGPSNDDPHTITGTILTGAGTVMCEGSGVSRIGDIIEGNDSHEEIAVILTGSPSVFGEGTQIARIGDYFEGDDFEGTLITGAATVYAI